MSKTKNFKCQQHTPCPTDYVGWEAWAVEKAKTHRQVRCLGCGLYKVWVPKPSKPKMMAP